MRQILKSAICIAILLLLITCEKEKENLPPTCEITSPKNDVNITKGQELKITISANDSDGEINEIKLYIDNIGVTSSSYKTLSYNLNTDDFDLGKHDIKAIATDNGGLEATVEGLFYIVLNIAELTTDTVMYISDTKAYVKGRILNNGGTDISEKGFIYGENEDLVTNGTKLSVEEETQEFSAFILDLQPNTAYYVQSYAINNEGTAYGELKSFTTIYIEKSTVEDFEGNIYKTVKIGEQWWMAENLKSKYYSDGTSIKKGRINGDIPDDDTLRYWYVYNGDNSYKDERGLLYSWHAAMDNAPASNSIPSNVQGVCPTGWHLPSDKEWMELESYLGMSDFDLTNSSLSSRGSDEGGMLKEIGNNHWTYPNTGAVDLYGFSAIPGGIRLDEQILSYYLFLNSQANYWTTSYYTNPVLIWTRELNNDKAIIIRWPESKTRGLSVRCVKD